MANIVDLMDVLTADGVDLAWLAWHTPAPAVTVLVGTAVAMDGWGARGENEPASSSLEVARLGDDLAPYKPDVDVLLSGFAFSARPQQAIAIELALGELLLRATTRALLPSTRIPLDAAHAFDVDGAPVELARRAGFERRSEVPLLMTSFDFSTFQLARREQRLSAIADCAALRLTALRPGGNPWEGRLPPPPRLAVRRRTGPWRAVSVRVDTVRVCTESGSVALAGRAIVEHPEDVVSIAGWAGTNASLEGVARGSPFPTNLGWPS